MLVRKEGRVVIRSSDLTINISYSGPDGQITRNRESTVILSYTGHTRVVQIPILHVQMFSISNKFTI